MPVKVAGAQFVRTAVKPEDWPPPIHPEFAFVGRSNVGKSSMLNALTRTARLARVSNTPGRTRSLNFFDVKVQPSPAAAARTLRLCDLPGYGYAKVSKAERASWARMIEGYLKERGPLKAVVLIVDARHGPTAEDADAFEFLSASGRTVIVAATKADKLPKNQRFGAARACEKALGLEPQAAILFSSEDGTGFDVLWARLLALA